MTSTTNTATNSTTAIKITTNGYYIHNNTIKTIEEGSWMVFDLDNDRERLAYCSQQSPHHAWVGKDENHAEGMADLLPQAFCSVFMWTKIYTSVEEAQAAL